MISAGLLWVIALIVCALTAFLCSRFQSDPHRPARNREPRQAADAGLPMGEYHQFLIGLARELGTANMDTIYAHHDVYCAQCGVQFTREALAHLDLFTSGEFGSSGFTVVGATQGGAAIRSGRCPQCGSTRMRIAKK